jgi:hypothetical protein
MIYIFKDFDRWRDFARENHPVSRRGCHLSFVRRGALLAPSKRGRLLRRPPLNFGFGIAEFGLEGFYLIIAKIVEINDFKNWNHELTRINTKKNTAFQRSGSEAPRVVGWPKSSDRI